MDFSASPAAAPVFHRIRRQSFSLQLTEIKDYLVKNRKVYSILAVILFAFYWFQLRPIQINRACSEQASANAQQLLVNKVAITTDANQRAAYEEMVGKHMYLRTDYESFYIKCLRNEGINVWGIAK